MTTTELKQQLLSLSFGGVLYDVTDGSEVSTIVREFDRVAVELADSIKDTDNGIDKGVKNFINEVLER